MQKQIHKCMSCERIIGVNIIPGSKKPDEVIQEIECIKCYNKQDWNEE